MDIRGHLGLDPCLLKRLGNLTRPVRHLVIQFSNKRFCPSCMTDVAGPHQGCPLSSHSKHHLLGVDLLANRFLVSKSVLKREEDGIGMFQAESV